MQDAKRHSSTPKNKLGISSFFQRRADWRTAMSGVSQAPNDMFEPRFALTAPARNICYTAFD